MALKKFNPEDWRPPSKNESKGNYPQNKYPNPLGQKADLVEVFIKQIEATSTDITGSYHTWRDIAFALSDEFHESGRDYFHRISRFHSEYNSKECDSQYDHCLRSKGSGISIGTFFHHAKAAGIRLASQSTPNSVSIPNSVSKFVETRHALSPAPIVPPFPNPNDTDEEPEEEEEEKMPVFPDSVFENLPIFLQKVIHPASSPEERDLLLLGSITTLSACFAKVHGLYAEKKVYSNLYLFVTGPASSGKGRLSFCKQLVIPIHKLMRDQAKVLKLQHAKDLAEFNMNKNEGEKPTKPPERMLFIPANNSSTGVFQLLSDNKGRGLIFETEGDTLSNSFGSDHGNFSDGLRKAWHHETISYYRRTDREYVDIEYPCISTVLSGTPKQVMTLIPSAENGLFSRFIYYCLNLQPVWKNVFARSTENGSEEYYDQLGLEFLEFYKTLNQNNPIEIRLTPQQEDKFNASFEKLQIKYLNVQDEEYIATIRRLGLICFRFAMILSTLRIMEDGDVSPVRQCEDEDYDTGIVMVQVLVKHSDKVFAGLPSEAPVKKKSNKRESFLEALPHSFDKEKYMEIAQSLNINPRTSEGYITKFVKGGAIIRNSKSEYLNPAKKETPSSQ